MSFTKDVSQNLEIIRDMISSLPPQGRSRARDAAKTMERAMNSLRVNGGENDPAIILGVALAACMIAEAMTQEKEGERLIELLS